MAKKYTKTQIKALDTDNVFQKRVAEDVELKRLFEAPKRTRDDRITELALALGGTAELGDARIPAPTPGILMLLGVIESPLLDVESTPRLIDVDIALWIFVNGESALNGAGCMADIERIAANACINAGVNAPEAWKLMRSMTWESFAGLERIPSVAQPGTEKKKCRFDLGWFASITSRISEAANVTADVAGWQIPLALGSHFLTALHQKNGGKIYEPNASEKVMERLNQLMDERIQEKKYK